MPVRLYNVKVESKNCIKIASSVMTSEMFIYTAIVLCFVWLFNYWNKCRERDQKLKWMQKITGWPIVGTIFQFKDRTKILPKVRKYLMENNGIFYTNFLTHPFIVISDYKILEWLLSSTSLLEKNSTYNYLHRWLGDGILITYGPKWKKSRKILTPAFHFSILAEFVTKFEKPLGILMSLLNNEVNKEIDIQPFITNYSLDIICETAMGIEMEAQIHPESEYVQAVHYMCQLVFDRTMNLLHNINWTYKLTSAYRRELKYVNHLHSVSNGVIKMKRNNLETVKTDTVEIGSKKKLAFLDLLLQYRDETGQPLTDKFIREQVDTIMFAGHDTTSSGICFALYCLSNHPEEQERAFNEVRDILGGKDKMTYTDLQNLKYLELIIKETLRLYPSVPTYARKLREDVAYEDNKVFPKGVTLLISAYSVNRNPEVFKEPEKFIPTRFLDTNIRPFSYLPFSAGPRNCIGQKFSMLEMKATLAKILLNFELLPTNPEHKVIVSTETVLKSQNGYRMKLKQRKA